MQNDEITEYHIYSKLAKRTKDKKILNEEDAFKSSTYTTGAYIITVILLILPYLLLESYMYALVFTILVTIIVILVFNFYISLSKVIDFKARFFEMAGISLCVAILSFLIGVVVRTVFGIDI